MEQHWLAWLARAFALLGGLLLTLMAAVTCVAIAGREIAGWSLAGDFELSAAAAGIGVALFLPMSHLRGGNILVDAFSTRLPQALRARMDRIGFLAVSVLTGLLAWRTALGGYSAFSSHSASMLLGFPDWVVYAGMVPPFALTAAIALRQALQGRSR